MALFLWLSITGQNSALRKRGGTFGLPLLILTCVVSWQCLLRKASRNVAWACRTTLLFLGFSVRSVPCITPSKIRLTRLGLRVSLGRSGLQL